VGKRTKGREYLSAEGAKGDSPGQRPGKIDTLKLEALKARKVTVKSLRPFALSALNRL
jgi:hypothetical protein